MTLLQAILIAIVQGATELFPISSLGHAVILPRLLGWNLDQHAPSFLPFLVLLHLGTAAALLLYFWRDWWALLTGVLGLADAHRTRESRHIAWLLIIATLPAVILGAGLEHALRRLFGTPSSPPASSPPTASCCSPANACAAAPPRPGLAPSLR